MPDEDQVGAEPPDEAESPRRELERRLREIEGHLQSILDSADNFVIYRMRQDRTEPRGAKVVFVSPSVTEIMGINDPLNYESWFERIHPDDLPRISESARRGLDTGKFNEVMRIFHPAKNEWRWIHGMTTAFPGEDGRLFYANGLMIDVTDQMRAQESLEAARAELAGRAVELERLNAALSVLLERRDQERRQLEQGILENIRVLIRPFLMRLRRPWDARERESLIDLIDENLNEITSKFAPRMSSGMARLTPTEVRVATLIRDGRSSKEVADLLGTSVNTISGHRRSIRDKLGLKSRKQNLRSYLQNQVDPDW